MLHRLYRIGIFELYVHFSRYLSLSYGFISTPQIHEALGAFHSNVGVQFLVFRIRSKSKC